MSQAVAAAEERDALSAELESLRIQAEVLALRDEVELRSFERNIVRRHPAYESSGGDVVVQRFAGDLRNLQGMHREIPYQAFSSGRRARQNGEHGPWVRNEQDLAILRDLSRWLVETNPYLTGLFGSLTNYVVGTGMVHKVTSRSSASKRTTREIERWVDWFLEVNEWDGDRDREAFRRDHRDGQAFVRLFAQNGGEISTMRFVEPEYLGEPTPARDLEDYLSRRYPTLGDWSVPQSWRFGVHTLEQDVEAHIGYFVDWQPGQKSGDWDYVPADRCTYWKANTDRTVKVGIPDTFAVQGVAMSVLGLARSILAGARAQAKVAYYTQYETGTTGEGVERMVAGEHARRGGGERTEYLSSNADDAEVRHVPNGRSIKHGPEGASSIPGYSMALQAGLRCIGARWCAPEFLVSADASNANYSSTLVAQSPFVLSVVAEQVRFAQRMAKLCWDGLRLAYHAGVFRGLPHTDSFETLRRAIRIVPEGPAILSEDSQSRLAETQRRLLLVAAGLMSDKTASSEENLEYEEQQSEGAQSRDTKPEEFISPGAPGSASAERGAAVQEAAARLMGRSRQLELWKGYP